MYIFLNEDPVPVIRLIELWVWPARNAVERLKRLFAKVAFRSTFPDLVFAYSVIYKTSSFGGPHPFIEYRLRSNIYILAPLLSNTGKLHREFALSLSGLQSLIGGLGDCISESISSRTPRLRAHHLSIFGPCFTKVFDNFRAVAIFRRNPIIWTSFTGFASASVISCELWFLD